METVEKYVIVESTENSESKVPNYNAGNYMHICIFVL